MEKITLKQLTEATNIHVKQLVILNDKVIKNVDLATLREFESYQVVSIDLIMESSYNNNFQTMHVESGISLTLIKN